MASECRLQVNFKDGKADLINVYAQDADELTGLLSVLAESAPNIRAVESALRGAPATPTGQQFAAPQQYAQPTTTQQAVANLNAAGIDTTVVPQQAGNACAHGPMNYKEGVNKAGKAYKGWFCTVPRSSCSPIWA